MVRVPADEDRSGQPIEFLNGRFLCKVSGSQTRGGLCIFDTLRTRPGGPPLHFHADVDEWFLVVAGEFLFQIGDQRLALGPGDSVLGPRGVPHAFMNRTETGRLTIAFHPAGTMEEFFRIGAERSPLSPSQFDALSSQHGMTVVGPPLAG